MDFRELPDGTLVEAIEDPHDPSKLLLAICENGRIRFAEKLASGGQVFVPLQKNSGAIRHLRFANGCEDYESTKSLMGNLEVLLLSTLDLSYEQAFLLSGFVISTCLIERLPVAPYVAFVGPPGTGKTTALRILDLVCRRSLITADISSAAFYEIGDKVATTVLIDETATTHNRGELFHLLRAGNTQGLVTFRKNKSFQFYGARGFSFTELPDDEALNSRCILIPMKCSRREHLLLPTDPKVVHLAETLRKRLLQFRLLNYKTVTPRQLPGEAGLQPRTRDLFRALALPLQQEPELCEALSLLLRRQQSLRSVLSENQSVLLDCLFRIIHASPKVEGSYIAEIATQVNARLRERGESGKISERKLGSVLTSLNLTNRTRTNAGWTLWFNRQTRREIHSLALRHCHTTGLSPELAIRCDICQEAKKTSTNGAIPKPPADGNHATADSSTGKSERSERRARIKGKGQKSTQSAGKGKPRRKA